MPTPFLKRLAGLERAQLDIQKGRYSKHVLRWSIVHLEECLNGIQAVSGLIPLISTRKNPVTTMVTGFSLFPVTICGPAHTRTAAENAVSFL